MKVERAAQFLRFAFLIFTFLVKNLNVVLLAIGENVGHECLVFFRHHRQSCQGRNAG
ncbi:MAG: hypothetical protein J0I10_01930 [Verrucomicrobia bacterium]|nr:hypothetical protein [Verrucomicrobiota bacterium]